MSKTKKVKRTQKPTLAELQLDHVEGEELEQQLMDAEKEGKNE